MPSKSQRSRKKRSFKGKRKKSGRSPPVVVSQQQAATQTYEPVTPSKVAAPSASKPTQEPMLTAARYPYIFTELRRTGILAGIMLAILVVLALVLS